MALGDSTDPDAEEAPPEDLLLGAAVAGNLVWNELELISWDC